MSRLIYIETSIPSFYFETRPQPTNQARREWTREWWDFARWQDELVTSLAVLDELEHTPEPKRSEMLGFMEPLPLLESAPAIEDMVTHYLQHMVMPADADGDARHLALATFHKCDILLTWNCQHPPALPFGLCFAQAISLRSVAAISPTPTRATTSAPSISTSVTTHRSSPHPLSFSASNHEHASKIFRRRP